MWGLSRGEGEFLWKSIYSRHSRALPKAPGCVRVPCSGTDTFGVTLQTRDPGFQIVITSQDHVLVFLYEVFLYPLGADMVSPLCPTPTSWRFPHCLLSPTSVPGSCEQLCWHLGDWNRTPSKPFSCCVFWCFHTQEVLLIFPSPELEGFNTIFYTCRQFLPPETITVPIQA